MTPILAEIYAEIVKWLKRVWFEARLQMIVWENLKESGIRILSRVCVSLELLILRV